MATKIKEFSFFDDHHKVDISYLFGGDVSDLIAFIKTRHKDAKMYSWGKPFEWGDDADTTDAYQFHVNAPYGRGEKFYVWIYELDANLLYHETFHLAGDIYFTRGAEYNYGSEELYAYYGAWIFEKICNYLDIKFRVKK